MSPCRARAIQDSSWFVGSGCSAARLILLMVPLEPSLACGADWGTATGVTHCLSGFSVLCEPETHHPPNKYSAFPAAPWALHSSHRGAPLPPRHYTHTLEMDASLRHTSQISPGLCAKFRSVQGARPRPLPRVAISHALPSPVHVCHSSGVAADANRPRISLEANPSRMTHNHTHRAAHAI